MRQRGRPQRGSYDQERPSDISVFIGGLPNDTTYQDVREMCQKFGKTSRVFLQFNKVTNEFSGNAFARFINRYDAQNFMKQTHLTQFRGAILNVNIATNPASQPQDNPPPPPPPPPSNPPDSRPYYSNYPPYPQDPYDYRDPGVYYREPADPSLYYRPPESHPPRHYRDRNDYISNRRPPTDNRDTGYIDRESRYPPEHDYRDSYENERNLQDSSREQRGYDAYDRSPYPPSSYYPEDRTKPRNDDYNYDYDRNGARDQQQPPPPPPPPSAGARDYAYADPYPYNYNARSIR